jgi:hypothetical protein
MQLRIAARAKISFFKGTTMRVLLGGIIGAVASAAAWFFLEYATGHEMGWLAILVGVITGLCINSAAGPSATESYARGALAVILTMIAMVGGRAVYAKVMQNVSNVTTLAPAARTVDDTVAGASAQVAQGDDAAAESLANQQAQGVRGRAGEATLRMSKPTVNSYKEMEVVWMAAAALCAYFAGKGSGKAAPLMTNDVPDGAAGTPA